VLIYAPVHKRVASDLRLSANDRRCSFTQHDNALRLIFTADFTAAKYQAVPSLATP